MNINIKRNILLDFRLKTLSVTIIMSMLMLCGCVDDQLILKDDGKDIDVIRIRATLKGADNSRAYYDTKEEKLIDYGEFYIAYPYAGQTVSQSSYAVYKNGIIEFGNAEDPTIGYARYDKDGVWKDLKWSNVYGQGRTSMRFCVNNIDPNLYTGAGEGYHPNSSGDQKYRFKSNYDYETTTNPYIASPLDKVNGSNDMLISGGETPSSWNPSVSATSGDIHLYMYHRLALLDLNIEVYSPKDDNYVACLDRAVVKITNVYRELRAINIEKAYDSAFLPDSMVNSPDRSSWDRVNYNNIWNFGDVLMVGPKPSRDTYYGWEEYEDAYTGKSINYKESTFTDENGEEYIVHTYSPQDFVFPPQKFKTQQPPMIVIRVPKEDITGSKNDEGKYMIYRGYLPTSMFDSDSDDITPLDTKFTSGYILHVTATIDSPNTELSFAPVRIENWVSKGSFTVSTKKAGIYTANDFDRFIEAYKSSNLHNLEKYGFKSGNEYFIQFWSSIELIKENIANKIKLNSDIPFSFILNNYSVILDKETPEEERLSGINGQNTLFAIVTGEDESQRLEGIKNSQEFIKWINLCHASDGYTAPDKTALMKYGTLNTYNNLWTFYLNEDIEVNYEDIFQMIDPNFINSDFILVRQGHSIVVNIGNYKFECEEDEGYDQFIMLAQVHSGNSIEVAADFHLLAKWYGNLSGVNVYEDVLNFYGSKSETTGSWTFLVKNAITIKGSKTFMSMVPDESLGRPDYSLSYPSSSNQNLLVTFDDEKTPFSCAIRNSSYIKSALSGTGYERSSQTRLKDIVGYYNRNEYQYLWYYGRFENDKWIFPLTYKNYQQNISYNDLYGKMVVDESEGRYDFEFYLGEASMQVKDFINGSSTRYFYQNDTNSSYPNSVGDLKLVANGTCWDVWE